MRRHELTDAQWNLIKDHLPGKRSDPGRTAKDNRRFVDGVLWLARTGAPWRDLPERYGPWNSAFQRYSRWSKRGIWQRVLESLGGDENLEHLLCSSKVIVKRDTKRLVVVRKKYRFSSTAMISGVGVAFDAGVASAL